MSLRTIALSPPSPFSSDPIGDATIALAQVAPGVTPKFVYWNDPQVSSGVGTGLWQFKGSAYYLMPGTTEPILFTIGCSGIAATSVGGPKFAAAPNFTGIPDSQGPIFPVSPAGGRQPPGGPVTVITLSGSVASSVLADIQNMTTCFNTGSLAPKYRYYYDPQTSVGHGTGIWRAQGYAPLFESNSQGSAGFPCAIVVQAGGCSLISDGCESPSTPPTVWTGFTQVANMFPLL